MILIEITASVSGCVAPYYWILQLFARSSREIHPNLHTEEFPKCHWAYHTGIKQHANSIPHITDANSILLLILVLLILVLLILVLLILVLLVFLLLFLLFLTIWIFVSPKQPLILFAVSFLYSGPEIVSKVCSPNQLKWSINISGK